MVSRSYCGKESPDTNNNGDANGVWTLAVGGTNESATETILLYIFYCVSCIAGRNILQRYMRKMKRSWCQKIFWLHGAQSLRIKTSGKPSIVQAHLVLDTGEVQVIEYNSVQIHTIPRQNQAYRVDVYLYWLTILIVYRNLNSFLGSELQYL